MSRIGLGQARGSANASALAPSAAARPNVRSTMVIVMLLQTQFLLYLIPGESARSGGKSEIGTSEIIANSKATILLACFASAMTRRGI
ncbi:hypothetical protein [Novosphingobium malaysiense]|uniref:hypothetical protein n=1 Tax=Novosphingobium malaysiense TaxID=1348853 RepID=UPI0012E040A8|nr:hypothetical protein [Novosphingobium malaysiense]